MTTTQYKNEHECEKVQRWVADYHYEIAVGSILEDEMTLEEYIAFKRHDLGEEFL